MNEGTLSDGTDSPGCDSLAALCGNLTTATNINRALAQVFLLMAQGRISQKQAVAFGYLSQLLLQTVPGIRGEFVSAFGYHPWEEKLKRSLAPNQNEDPSPSGGGGETPEQPTHGVVEPKKAVGITAFFQHDKVPPPSVPEPAPPAPVTSLRERVTSPDYASLLSRSSDLFDGKYDTTPEGRREANALVTELELTKPPSSKPPKDFRGRAIELVKRFRAHKAKAPGSQGASANASSPPPTPGASSVPANLPQPPAASAATPPPQLPIPLSESSPGGPIKKSEPPTPSPRPEVPPAPPSHAALPPETKTKVPLETKRSLWDGGYRPPAFVDPLNRPTAFERKLRRMSSHGFRHFLQLQHSKSFFD